MNYQDFLNTLGLGIDSSVADVKKAYRKLVKQWHPDRFYDSPAEQKNASDKFRKITEAYQFLLDHFREPETKERNFKSHIKIEKTNPEFFYCLGLEFAKAEEYNEAINAFTQAIRCDGSYLKAYQYRAFLLEKLGFDNRAKTDFEKIDQLKKTERFTSNSQQNSTNQKKKTTTKKSKPFSNDIQKNHENVYLETNPWSGNFLNFSDAISATAVNRLGNLVVVAQENKNLYLRSLIDNQSILTYQLAQTTVRKIIFNPTQEIFYFGGDDGKIYYCSISSAKISLFSQLKFQHTNKVTSLAISQNGKLLLSGSADKTLKIWNTDRDIEPITLYGFGSEITSIIITPDDQSMIIASLDKNIRFRSLETGKLLKSIPVNCGIASMAISQNGNFLSVGGFDRVISIWDINTREIITILNGHQALVYGLYFVSNDKFLISVGGDGLIYSWDWRSHSNLKIGNHYGAIVTSAISPDNKTLITGAKDKRLGIWFRK